MKHANIAFFIPHLGCPNKCSFCNQNTISGKTQVPKAQDIQITLNKALSVIDSDRLCSTEIAFFGGSFTAIDREYMIELLSAAQPFLGHGKFSGIRISTRPDAINKDILDILKKYGVSAIELGAQSMCDEVLLKNMRGHTAEDVVNASNLIKECGFSLGLQMMTGLYADSDEKSLETAKKIVSLKPDTVRIYPTVVLNGTYLGELFVKGVYTPPKLDETVALCAKLLSMFEENSIKVIRIGLHNQPELKENVLAGAYHPALGELILSERLFQKALLLLKNRENENTIITVNSSRISQMLGQKKKNVEKFKSLGYNVEIRGDNALKFDDIKLI